MGVQAVIEDVVERPFVLYGAESEVPRRFVAEPDGLTTTVTFADGTVVEGTARRGRMRFAEDVAA